MIVRFLRNWKAREHAVSLGHSCLVRLMVAQWQGYSLLTSIPVSWCPKLSLARQVFQQVSFMCWLFWSNHQLTEPHYTVCPVGCMRKKVILVLSPKLIKLTIMMFRALALSSDEGLVLLIRLRRLFDIMALVVRLFEKIRYPSRARFLFTITWL